LTKGGDGLHRVAHLADAQRQFIRHHGDLGEEGGRLRLPRHFQHEGEIFDLLARRAGPGLRRRVLFGVGHEADHQIRAGIAHLQLRGHPAGAGDAEHHVPGAAELGVALAAADHDVVACPADLDVAAADPGAERDVRACAADLTVGFAARQQEVRTSVLAGQLVGDERDHVGDRFGYVNVRGQRRQDVVRKLDVALPAADQPVVAIGVHLDVQIAQRDQRVVAGPAPLKVAPSAAARKSSPSSPDRELPTPPASRRSLPAPRNITLPAPTAAIPAPRATPDITLTTPMP
jgi:hypothetical protein